MLLLPLPPPAAPSSGVRPSPRQASRYAYPTEFEVEVAGSTGMTCGEGSENAVEQPRPALLPTTWDRGHSAIWWDGRCD